MDFIRYKDELISVNCIRAIRLHEGSKYTIILEGGRHIEIPLEWKDSVEAFLRNIEARIHTIGPDRSMLHEVGKETGEAGLNFM